MQKGFPARLLGMVLFADLQPQLHKDRDNSPGAGSKSLLVMFGAIPLCHKPAVPRENWDHPSNGN